MAKSHLSLITPATEKRTVAPKRPPNADLRTREYLTQAEVERLLNAARGNRWAHRDATMILVAYRHGLRASELTDLRWDQVDFATAALHVRRVKQGSPSTHPILGDELRMLRRLQREQEPRSPFVFTSERGAPFSTAGFARMVERTGVEARSASRPIRICCGTPVALHWPPRATTPGRCRPTSATRTSSTRCATPSCHHPGSGTSGGLKLQGRTRAPVGGKPV